MSTTANFEIVFPDWYDRVGEMEAEAKGWLQGVEVRLPSGQTQALFFYDPVRLAQDLQEEARVGSPFIACPGLIVVPRITRTAIIAAVRKLIDEGYFPIHQGKVGCSINDILHDAQVPAA